MPKKSTICKIEAVRQPQERTKGGLIQSGREKFISRERDSFREGARSGGKSHTKWKCQYHVVFLPRYRRKEIYGKSRKDIGDILRRLCEYKDVEIIQAHACKDNIHMLLSIPPKMSVSDFMGYLKGKSSLMIFERHANLKYKYGKRSFWAKGYYVSTVGINQAVLGKYIREQETEDQLADQLTMKEYENPFEPMKEK